MYFSRTRKLTVNMGETSYESYAFEVMVGMGHSDLGYTDEDMAKMSSKESDEVWEKLRDTVLSRLDQELAQEVLDAKELTINRKSFVFRASHRSRSQSPKPAARVRKVRPRA